MVATGLAPGKPSMLVLVVDDSLTNRLTLEAMLRVQGFDVLTCENGRLGVQMFLEHRPGLVLMDMQMPEMDGIEATRRIKAAAGADFVPVIFVTSSEDEEIVRRCIDAGGDDFFQRPFSPSALHAKIVALQRIRNLYNQVRELNSLRKREEEIAEQLFSNAVEKGNVAAEEVHIYKRAATIFSGDVQLTAYRPNGDVNVLLGDFTGHGLTSVIGALPLSETFRAMTAKGYAGDEILRQINRKLKSLLPSGMFLAAALVTLDAEDGRAYIWNCGMPDVLVMDGASKALKQRVPSAEPPLGIFAQMVLSPPVVVPVRSDDRILLLSDGVQEAWNPQGEMFGEARLIEAAGRGMEQGSLTDEVVLAVGSFMAGRALDDDVSLIEVPCGIKAPQLTWEQVDRTRLPDGQSSEEQWCWEMVLRGSSLQRVNPVPLLISQLQELEGPGEHWQRLFTVVTELFVNAVDHGVLGLDSGMKCSPEGFARYFAEREQRLQSLQDGFVKIQVAQTPLPQGGRLKVRLKDSGAGFPYEHWLAAARGDCLAHEGLSGRGIKLLTELCETLEYRENGTLVEAGFIWSNDEQPG